jgi:hypothetical protein
VNKWLSKNQFVQNRMAGLGNDIKMMQQGNVLGGGGRLLGKAAIPLAALWALHKGYEHLRGGDDDEYYRPPRRDYYRYNN